MSQACLPEIVRVTVHEEPSGLLVAESPDLPGPLAVELNADRLAYTVPERIRAWFEAEGCPVEVIRGEGRIVTLSAWKVLPLDVRRGARDPVPKPNPPPPLPPSIDPSRPDDNPPPAPPLPVPDLPPPGRPPPRDPDPTR